MNKSNDNYNRTEKIDETYTISSEKKYINGIEVLKLEITRKYGKIDDYSEKVTTKLFYTGIAPKHNSIRPLNPNEKKSLEMKISNPKFLTPKQTKGLLRGFLSTNKETQN